MRPTLSRLVPLLAAALLLGGCSDDGGGTAEKGGTAAEYIRAGVPVDADAADDGSHLVLYRVPVEDDDGTPKTAWRLYDGGGSTVAQGTGGVNVTGTGNGFWLDDQIGGGQGGRFVSTAGKVSDLPTGSAAPQRGDVDISAPYSLQWTAYSPETKKVSTPTPAPVAGTQGWTLDPNGRQWAVDMKGRVSETIDGAWRTVRPVPLRKGQEVAGYGLTRVGEWLVVPVVRGVLPLEKTRYERFAARLNGAPPSVPWRMLAPGPLGKEPRAAHPDALGSNNHYVFWDFDGTPYALNMEGGAWVEVPLPNDEKLWSLQAGLDGLYAFAPEGSEATKGAWFSPDLGQSWVQMAR